MTRGGGISVPPKNDDVIYEQPLSTHFSSFHKFRRGSKRPSLSVLRSFEGKRSRKKDGYQSSLSLAGVSWSEGCFQSMKKIESKIVAIGEEEKRGRLLMLFGFQFSLLILLLIILGWPLKQDIGVPTQQRLGEEEYLSSDENNRLMEEQESLHRPQKTFLMATFDKIRSEIAKRMLATKKGNPAATEKKMGLLGFGFEMEKRDSKLAPSSKPPYLLITR